MLFACVTSGGVLRNFTRQLEKLCFFPFFIPGCCVLHISFYLFSLPFSLLQRTGFYFPHWLSLSLSHSVTFPFTVPFLQTVNWLSKKFFLWTFLTTREKGKMQINPNLCFIGNDEAQVKARLMFALLCVEIWMII